jgi:glycosyltransferase involved in cell wall biosynthesis
MSTIDVIIPIKGRPEMLKERSLPSLLNQSYKDFKVTVVDDGSDHHDFEFMKGIVTEYRGFGLDIQLLRNSGTPGAAGARNFGFVETSNEYVLWYDSDDILLNQKLKISLDLIGSKNFDFAITRAQHIKEGQLIDEFWGEPIAPNRGKYEFHFPYQTMCALYSRLFLSTTKLRWNEQNNSIDDWEISNAAILTSSNWVYSPVVTAHYFVPTLKSGSIGSKMNADKIKSQQKAMERIRSLMLQYALLYSTLSKAKIIKHKAFLMCKKSFRL